MRWALACLMAACVTVVPGQALAQQDLDPPPAADHLPKDPCRANPQDCGIPLRIGENLGGLRNCPEPNCISHRIVDLAGERNATDYIPVPDATDPDGNPACIPRPAGRVPPDWWQIDLPTDGAVAMNPDPKGLTGLDSWFWYDGTTEISWQPPVYVGVRGDCTIIPAPPPAIHTARVTAWRYDVEDTRPGRYTATQPGSEEEPAATHQYRTKGEWDVTITCTWQLAPDVTTTQQCATRDVPVIEIRSVHIRE
jgi:hypothetical protein